MRRVLILFFIFLFGIFFINTFHEEYPDEYDSIVGGRYITEGKLPYKDWFQHHQPGAYVLAAAILPFSGQSFVRFREILAVVFFAINLLGLFILKKRAPEVGNAFYLFYLLFVGLGATYFWGHMLLADTLSTYLFIPGFVLLLIKTYYDKKFEEKDLFLVSLFTFLAWFTSMTLSYVIIGVDLIALYQYVKTKRSEKTPWLTIGKKSAILLLAPYLIYLLYLVGTGSFKDFYFANITYNQEYYIYNYPRPPGARFNPIRYAVIIGNAFINNYFPALAGVAGMPLGNPLQVTVAVSHAIFIVVLLIKKKISLLIAFLFVLVFSTARSNPQQLKEIDYQNYLYLLSAYLVGSFSWFALKEMLDGGKEKLSNVVLAGSLFVPLTIFGFFSTFYLGMKLEQRFYPKYMGEAPFIYDDPQIAPVVNKIVTQDDYAWIGPFEFKELFYLKTKKLPSKYHWFLQHAATSKIKDELIADLTARRPKVIVFKRNYAPWGGDPAGFNYFFTDFLDKHYFRIFVLNRELKDYMYQWKVSDPRNFDINGDFNFDLERKDEILKELEEKGLIEKKLKT